MCTLRQFAFVCVSPVGFSCINIKDTFQALNIFFFLKLLITKREREREIRSYSFFTNGSFDLAFFRFDFRCASSLSSLLCADLG